jgi:hypothetical protein
MSKRWWDDPSYPKSRWQAADWADWEKHGRPRTPHDKSARLRLPRLDAGPPPVVPDRLVPAGFGGLYAKPSRPGARSREAARALQELGIKPRSSRRGHERAIERVQAGDGITIRRSGIGAVLGVR